VDGQGHTFAGKASWYVLDGLGSVVGEVDPLGNLTSSPKYDVYGAVRSNGGSASSKQGFVGSLGHISDDTGLIYMRARYYDSNLGRFVSQAPSGNGNNWFVYCGDNPVNQVDSTGRFPLPLRDWEFFIHFLLENAMDLVSSAPDLYALARAYIGASKVSAALAGGEEAVGLRDKLAGDDLQGDALQGAAGRDAITAANDVAKAEELEAVADWISEGNPNSGDF
jgi:RHS repeat-associated protein